MRLKQLTIACDATIAIRINSTSPEFYMKINTIHTQEPFELKPKYPHGYQLISTLPGMTLSKVVFVDYIKADEVDFGYMTASCDIIGRLECTIDSRIAQEVRFRFITNLPRDINIPEIWRSCDAAQSILRARRDIQTSVRGYIDSLEYC